MNTILEILKEHETDIKHRPRCILSYDYNALARDLEELIAEAYSQGYIKGGMDYIIITQK